MLELYSRKLSRALFVLGISFSFGVTSFAFAEETPVDPRISPELLTVFTPHELKLEEITLPYRLMRPISEETGKTYPLVLFLHGLGERGDDNQRQLIHGGKTIASEGFRRRYPAFFVAPQCPGGLEPNRIQEGEHIAKRFWTWHVPRDARPTIDLEKPSSLQLEAVRTLVGELMETLPIDPDRVYVTGLSMGGFGTWSLAIRDPEIYAAAVPVCGASDSKHANRLVAMPLWAFHGADDNVILPECSREMIAAIRAVGGRPIHTEYAKTGHNSWDQTYQSQEMWDWMFAQRRAAK